MCCRPRWRGKRSSRVVFRNSSAEKLYVVLELECPETTRRTWSWSMNMLLHRNRVEMELLFRLRIKTLHTNNIISFRLWMFLTQGGSQTQLNSTYVDLGGIYKTLKGQCPSNTPNLQPFRTSGLWLSVSKTLKGSKSAVIVVYPWQKWSNGCCRSRVCKTAGGVPWEELGWRSKWMLDTDDLVKCEADTHARVVRIVETAGVDGVQGGLCWSRKFAQCSCNGLKGRCRLRRLSSWTETISGLSCGCTPSILKSPRAWSRSSMRVPWSGTHEISFRQSWKVVRNKVTGMVVLQGPAGHVMLQSAICIFCWTAETKASSWNGLTVYVDEQHKQNIRFDTTLLIWILSSAPRLDLFESEREETGNAAIEEKEWSKWI